MRSLTTLILCSHEFLTLRIYTLTVMRGGVGMGTSKRGFASMDADKQREIASKGGKASSGNFKYDPERARAAGRKGGSK